LAGGRAQGAKHAKKDIMTAGYRRLQLICTHFFACQGMVLFLIVRSDQEIKKNLCALSVFAVQQEVMHAVHERPLLTSIINQPSTIFNHFGLQSFYPVSSIQYEVMHVLHERYILK